MSEHIIFTGPQRSGKSFMLEILTRLGADTGFTMEEIISGDNKFLEFRFWGEHYKRNPPYIIKHAKLSTKLADRAKVFDWKIEKVLIFVRKMEDSVESTHKLRGEKKPTLKHRYFYRLGHIVYDCVRNGWYYVFVDYDKMISDWRYAMKITYPLNDTFTEKEFKAAWKETKKRTGK